MGSRICDRSINGTGGMFHRHHDRNNVEIQIQMAAALYPFISMVREKYIDFNNYARIMVWLV